MLSVDPRGFSRGKRGIAGSLIFTIFDRAALSSITEESADVPTEWGTYFAKSTDITSPGNFSALRGSPNDIPSGFGLTQVGANGIGPQTIERRVVYVDQMPPFDITLTGQNEMGQRMMMQIYGVELLNQGSGVSVDDSH
jgi:hypothetical protein